MARILLAESNRRIRAFLAGILTDFGHDVVSCADGTEAGVRLAAKPVDLVVTDLVLSEGERADLLGACTARGIPAVTLTGRRFRGDRRPRNQPLPLLEKPFRIRDLHDFLDAVAGCTGSRQAATTVDIAQPTAPAARPQPVK